MLSVIITTRNEGDELLWTCENVRMHAGCEHEVIVVDDASTDGSADRLPGWVRVLRRTKADRLGVAPARRAGVAMAEGDAFLFLDAHMRVEPGGPARLYGRAQELGGIVTAMLGNLYGSNRCFYNSGLRIDKAKGRLCSGWGRKPKTEVAPIQAFVAPGYVLMRDSYERVGGWPSRAQGWGQTEVCLSLKLLLAGEPMHIDTGVRMLHKFRAGETSDPVPYPISGYDPVRNNYVMCRTCFAETLEEFWVPLAQAGRHWDRSWRGKEMWSDAAEAEREAFQAVKTMPDAEFFPAVLGMTYEQAQEKYLTPEEAVA